MSERQKKSAERIKDAVKGLPHESIEKLVSFTDGYAMGYADGKKESNFADTAKAVNS